MQRSILFHYNRVLNMTDELTEVLPVTYSTYLVWKLFGN